MARIPIALELYSVRNELAADPPGTLKKVAEMGYQGVEFAGEPVGTPGEIKEWLEAAGLVCCGWHTAFQRVQPEALAETIALNKAIGNSRIIIPGLPGRYTGTKQGWLEAAEFFNELAEKLSAEGMKTGYHNHRVEFQRIHGEIPWVILGENTRDDVILQIDTGNAYSGGGDPLDMLRRFPGRAETVHLKPYSQKQGKADPSAGYRTMIGEDDTPWEAIFEVCESSGGTQWYIVEYESDLYPPLTGVERCLAALRAMGK